MESKAAAQRIVPMANGRAAHASGALWLQGERTVVIADVHLGYAWAMRRRRQLGPVAEGGVQAKLRAVLQELEPKTVVLLGDVVHAPKPSPGERQLVEETLREIASRAQLVVVTGNHDRQFARDYAGLGLTIAHAFETETLLAVHGDKPVAIGGKHAVVGHIHPALGVVDDAGASQRVPVFLSGKHCTVLPAFSPFAAGMEIGPTLPEPVASWMCGAEVEVIAASGRRAVRIGPLRKIRW